MQTLPIYMLKASPRVPVITTRETTPRLLDKIPECQQEHNYCPLVPLSPTDDNQASGMLSFALRHQKRKFLILQEDEDVHRTYTDYLAGKLKENIKKRTDTEFISTEKVLATVSFNNVLSTITTYKPDCMFYVGGPDTVLKLNSYLDSAVSSGRLSRQDRPLLIASDGAVSDALLAKPTMVPFYVTHQLSLEEYREPSHVYGTDSFAVIAQLISQAGQKPNFHELGIGAYLWHLLSMHRVSDARTTISRIMEDNAHYAKPYIGRKDRIYSYFGRYNRLNAHFHVWRIDNQLVADADADADDEHDSVLPDTVSQLSGVVPLSNR
jgi:hypothetical protein